MQGQIHAAAILKLTADPELRTSQAGKPWTRLSMVVGVGDDSQFVAVACFGETAEQICETQHKGDSLYVEGTIRLNTWNDKSTGAERHGLNIAAWKVDPLRIGRRKEKRAKDDGADTQQPSLAGSDGASPQETEPAKSRTRC
jgi:single-strand DNA-binding protein